MDASADVESSLPPPDTVASAYFYVTETFKGRDAFVDRSGNVTTYDQIVLGTENAVRVLDYLGCKEGDRVALWFCNSPWWAFFEFACSLLGVMIVPLNLRFRAPEVEHALRISRAQYLVMQRSFMTNDLLSRLREVAGGAIETPMAGLPDLKSIVLLDGPAEPGTHAYEDLLTEATSSLNLRRLGADRLPTDPLWMFWTSGTTSAPKGVILDQSAITNVWNWTSMVGYRSDDRVLTTFPYFYVAGNFWCLLGPLLHGAVAVLSTTFSNSELTDLARQEDVTVLSGVPTMLRQLVTSPNFDGEAFRSVRLGFFGGGTMGESDLHMIREKLGYESLVQIYGMTELHGFATSTKPTDSWEITGRTCGTPLPGFTFRIVRPGTSEDVPTGEPGELLVKGRRLVDFCGITPEERAKYFDNHGWFHTGDMLLQRPDGRYEFVARIKDLIKVGGENVSAAEVEQNLRMHVDVREVAVIGIDDELRGETPVAFVERIGPVDTSELLAWCRTRMAPFKVPTSVLWIETHEWPRTDSGKIAKYRLVERMKGT